MVLSTQVTEGCAGRGYYRDLKMNPAITRETLASQLHEMEKVMANLGLEPKPETSVEASSGQPPSGFVHAEAQIPTQTSRGLREGDVDTPHGSDHRDLHHRRLGTFDSSPASLGCQVLQRHYAW